VGDFPLLVLAQGQLLLDVGLPLALELVVVAGPAVQGASAQLEDLER